MTTPSRPSAAARRKWTERAVAYTVSIGLHAAIFAAFLSTQITPVMENYNLAPVDAFVLTPAPEPPGAASAPKKAQPTPPKTEKPKTVPQKIVARVTPVVKTSVAPIVAGEPPAQKEHASLSDSDLEGAAHAGSGSGGGAACDMAAIVQKALREDATVQRAVARVNTGRAIHVWNGGWVRSPDEEGLGLAGVRETIMVKVGFAPAACRNAQMRGLVVFSLNDTARVVVGSGGSWRWSDMLGLRG